MTFEPDALKVQQSWFPEFQLNHGVHAMRSISRSAAQVENLPPEPISSAEPTLTGDVRAILREGREATLATLRPDGWPQATVINYVHDDENVYFDCAVSSQKAKNMAVDDRISLALVVPYAAYGPIFGLSLAGHARRLKAPAEIERVLDLWKIRYPYMRQRLERDLSGFAFYAVAPTVVTTLDYAAGLGHRHGG